MNLFNLKTILKTGQSINIIEKLWIILLIDRKLASHSILLVTKVIATSQLKYFWIVALKNVKLIIKICATISQVNIKSFVVNWLLNYSVILLDKVINTNEESILDTSNLMDNLSN